MNKIVKLSMFAAFAALSLNSCINETFPEGSTLTSDQAASSSTALEAMVNAIPVAMVEVGAYYDSSYHFEFAYPSLMMIYDNMSFNAISVCGDGNSGYNWFVYFCNGGGLGPDYSRTAYIWVSYFNFVKAANDVIATITASDDIPTTSMSYLAAAKAYRAMLYLDMARLYDPLKNDYTDISTVEEMTLPYISETTTEDEARFNPRMTRDEMFEAIFADLDSAEELYTTEGVEELSGTNPSLAVVYGLKARAYLWLGGVEDSSNYAKAAEYARKAIDASGCSIMSEATYCDKTNGFNTPTSSWMWYLPQSADATSNLLNYVAWMSSEASYGYGALVAMGIQSTNYDRISDTDFRKKLFLSGSPVYSDYASVTLVDEEYFASMFPYAGLKFRPLGGSINDYSAGNATSIPLMRVEEMYLIEAEATAQTDGASGAALLNTFMANRDASYSYTKTSSADVVEEILFQKGIELWGEGLYLFDAKRMGLGVSSGYSGTNVASDCLYNITGVAPWWNPPFPSSEIIQNTALSGYNNPDPSEYYVELLWEE